MYQALEPLLSVSRYRAFSIVLGCVTSQGFVLMCMKRKRSRDALEVNSSNPPPEPSILREGHRWSHFKAQGRRHRRQTAIPHSFGVTPPVAPALTTRPRMSQPTSAKHQPTVPRPGKATQTGNTAARANSRQGREQDLLCILHGTHGVFQTPERLHLGGWGWKGMKRVYSTRKRPTAMPSPDRSQNGDQLDLLPTLTPPPSFSSFWSATRRYPPGGDSSGARVATALRSPNPSRHSLEAGSARTARSARRRAPAHPPAVARSSLGCLPV